MIRNHLFHDFLFVSFCLNSIMLPSSAYAKPQKCKLSVQTQEPVQHPIPIGTTMTPIKPTTPMTVTTTSADITASTATAAPSKPSFVYGRDKIRGVNLGGWLVLEAWITPSLFEKTGNENIVDEFTFTQLQDPQVAGDALGQHWEIWITEDDFIHMAAAGLNHVRIPIGYWSIPLTAADTAVSTSPAPYIQGAWTYLLRALNWAQKYGISVLVDLHGAPGSQNGFDNSGQRTANPVWALTPDDITRTVDTLRFMAREVGSQVAIIELLNEPFGLRGEVWTAAIRDFYARAYQAVREVAGDKVQVMLSDAYVGVETWAGFLTPPTAQNTMMDTHDYHIFTEAGLTRTFDEHIGASCATIPAFRAYEAANLWTVLGEWSTVLTDCTRWINGRGFGARWDGTFVGPEPSRVHGSCAGWSGSYRGWTPEYIEMLRKYWEVQVEVGESVQGWVYWTWKTEDVDEWSYEKGLEGGWIPMDPTSRKYPNICG